MIFLTTKELSERLKVSRSTLSRLRANGKGPKFTKVGNTILYSEAVVEDWLDYNTFRTSQDALCEQSHHLSAFAQRYLSSNE